MLVLKFIKFDTSLLYDDEKRQFYFGRNIDLTTGLSQTFFPYLLLLSLSLSSFLFLSEILYNLYPSFFLSCFPLWSFFLVFCSFFPFHLCFLSALLPFSHTGWTVFISGFVVAVAGYFLYKFALIRIDWYNDSISPKRERFVSSEEKRFFR